MAHGLGQRAVFVVHAALEHRVVPYHFREFQAAVTRDLVHGIIELLHDLPDARGFVAAGGTEQVERLAAVEQPSIFLLEYIL